MADLGKSWRDEGGTGREEGRKEEEKLGNYRPLNWKYAVISKQFVSIQQITDNMESSGADYVRLIQFSLPKEGQCREDRGEALSVSCVLTVGRFMTVSH